MQDISTQPFLKLLNLPVIIKLTWLVKTVNSRMRSAAWLTIRHRDIVVTILPTKSRKVGITKYTIATIRRHTIATTCVIGLTIFLIRNSVFVHMLFSSGIHTTAYSLLNPFSILLKKKPWVLFWYMKRTHNLIKN